MRTLPLVRRAALLILIGALTFSVFQTVPSSAQEGKRRLAAYNLGPVQTEGSLAPYNVDPDLNTVILSEILNQDQKAYLARNLFVVSPSPELMFYTVYEKARYDFQPMYITVDSMLHSFHLVFKKHLRSAEMKFIPMLNQMNEALVAKSYELYQSLKGTAWENAALHTLAYFSMAALLLEPQMQVPAEAMPLVEPDLQNALAASAISKSLIFPALEFGEDWSQYKPRSYYADDEFLSNYFRCMMWYGRLTFRLSEPEETRSALLATLAFRDSGARPTWQRIYDVTTFFVGEADNPSIEKYLEIGEQVYGPNFGINELQSKDIDPFVEVAKALPAPRILNVVISDTDNIDEKTAGLAFMGQRFVWDAFVFRELIYRNVGTPENPRPLPMALDVFAALGSERALQILGDVGATGFPNYTEQMNKLLTQVGGVTDDEWTLTMYNSWLYALDSLTPTIPAGYPSFMSGAAYLDRLLYAALGSFTELKHNTVLYAKQAYAEMGGGGGIDKSNPPAPELPPNYVEPLPMLWARLAALAEMTESGLKELGLLETEFEAAKDVALHEVAVKSRRMQSFAEKELRGEMLTGEEQDELRFYGGWLENIYNATRDDPESNYFGVRGGFAAEEEPRAAVVTDIATDPQSGTVLQIGTGTIYNIFVVVPIGEKLWLTKGAVNSFYEFPHPLKDRLTDRQWWKMLDEGVAPSIPAWTNTFISPTSVHAELEGVINNFQLVLRDQLWWNPPDEYVRVAGDSSLSEGMIAYLRGQLEPLAAANQYEGRTLIDTSFRSYDQVNETTFIVTTRETWRGELYDVSDKGMDYDGTKVAERGPYQIDVTYTLELLELGDNTPAYTYWKVVNAVTNSPLPEWIRIQ